MIKIFENNQITKDTILTRSSLIFDEDKQGEVKEIIEKVKLKQDQALIDYTLQFDKVAITEIKVSQTKLKTAYDSCDQKLLGSLKQAKSNIEEYHSKQLTQNYVDYQKEGVVLAQVVSAIENIGLYIPGGSAAYPSTILMNVIPAQLAGCQRIVLVSPPTSNGQIADVIMATAYLCGIEEVYQVGGAQAIAALVYGTATIKKVDKICGPGNSYVSLAKNMLNGLVGIDMIAGPSEILVIADEFANPTFIAADLLAQAEHDPNAMTILIAQNKELAQQVNSELKRQISYLNRPEIIKEALQGSYIVIENNLEKACELANEVAPEHLELMVQNPFDLVSLIKNAGSIFLGAYAPEALGDYFAGPNHTLPTNGTARFSSALSVDDFIKKSSIIYYSKTALDNVKDDITRIAYAEKLDAHANAINVRFGDNKNE